ncbi:MAG: D-Ala-D-Ala carboxypeptidase family metallohydrolase [Waterburya sp.]
MSNREEYTFQIRVSMACHAIETWFYSLPFELKVGKLIQIMPCVLKHKESVYFWARWGGIKNKGVKVMPWLKLVDRTLYLMEDGDKYLKKIEESDNRIVLPDDIDLPINFVIGQMGKHPEKSIQNPPTMPREINWSDFNSKISKYFRVGEVTKYESRRIPQDSNVIANILFLAKELDKLREDWGSPIGVTSWYRPAEINKMAGGARNSQHITGGAADIYPLLGNRTQFEEFIELNWYGGVGRGMRSGKGFVHVDIRGNKGWKTGGTKEVRWNY